MTNTLKQIFSGLPSAYDLGSQVHSYAQDVGQTLKQETVHDVEHLTGMGLVM